MTAMRGGSALFKNRRPPPTGRQFNKRDPEALNKVIDLAFRRFGLSEEVSKYRFVLHWKEIVGEEIAKRSHPEYLKGSTLVIKVMDSAWSQELSFHKKVIITRLNKFLGKEDVKDILFVV
jgi:predicted nucleic acid-binding Zn ribbon protein